MAFSDQLRKLMNEKNMKAVELARSTGLSEAAISDYLKGKKEPRGRQSIAIAKALNVSLDTLWETDFIQKGFPARLKEARKAIGFTQQQVADKIGVAKSTYCSYENGSMEPNALNIKKIFKALNIDANYLLGVSNNIKTPPTPEKQGEPNTELVKALTDTLIKAGFIKAGEDLSDSDLEFCKALFLLIRAHYDK